MRTAFTTMLENKLRVFYKPIHVRCTQNLSTNSYNLVLIAEGFREKRIGKKNKKKIMHTQVFHILKDHINTTDRNRIQELSILTMADTDWDNRLIFDEKKFSSYTSSEIIKKLPGTLVK